MMPVSVCVSFLLLSFLAEHNSVEGATCSVVPTCEETDYTLSTCNQTSKICDCKPDFVPIRSGCGKKFEKPHVSAPLGGNSFQVKANTSFSLTCEPAYLNAATEFFKNELPTPALQNVSGDLPEVGDYSCKASFGELYSDVSPRVKFEVIGSNFSNVKPKIFVPVAKVFNMSVVPLRCQDIPIGYESMVFFKVNGTMTSPNITVSSENEQLPVSCGIKDSNKEVAESENVNLPSLTTTIDNVTVAVVGYAGLQTLVIKEATATGNPKLLCETSPPLEYLASHTTFLWKRNNTDIGAPISSNFYQLTEKDNATADYTCSVTYPGGTNATASRNVIKVIINEFYLKKPIISVSASKPLKGGRLKISCDSGMSMLGVVYSWKRGTDEIIGQLDKILQLDNLTANDNGEYKCLLIKDNFVVTSDPVKVEAASNISRPVVTKVGTNPNNTDLALGGSYTLTCTTESYTVGMIYTWLVNGTAKAGTQQTYSISNVKYTDAGNYTCKVAFQGQSVDSDRFELKTIEPGVTCTADSDCSKLGTGYTGKCDTTAKRCTCSSHYKMNGEKCESAARSMMSSTLVIVCAYVLSQLFSYYN